MNRVINFLSEVKLEISKVTWPSRNEVIKLTLIVIVISAVGGIYIGAVDYGFTKALEFIVAR